MTKSVLPKLSSIMIGLFSRPALLHWVMPVLMVYLILGTVAQKYIGLYDATQIFFFSPIIWVWIIPLPGLPILCGLIFLNLLGKLLFKSPWHWRQSGIIITHIGAMLLLLGGLLTALFSQEGFVDLAPGEIHGKVSDYHIREVVVLDDQDKMIEAIDFAQISKGKAIDLTQFPFTINVMEYCRNCKIDKRRYVTPDHYGMAQHMELSPGELRKTDEENLSGMVFSLVNNAEKTSNADSLEGIFLVLENIPKYPEFEWDGKTYKFALRKQERALPFKVELLEFERNMHPGTAMAKSYKSHIRIIDGPIDAPVTWEGIVEMNSPLRYKGYTLFQSSFVQTPDGDVSVLAVVWNAGRAFPYISGIVMCIGMLVHLCLRPGRKKTGYISGAGGQLS